jgi:hypothetical protein
MDDQSDHSKDIINKKENRLSNEFHSMHFNRKDISNESVNSYPETEFFQQHQISQRTISKRYSRTSTFRKNRASE